MAFDKTRDHRLTLQLQNQGLLSDVATDGFVVTDSNDGVTRNRNGLLQAQSWINRDYVTIN